MENWVTVNIEGMISLIKESVEEGHEGSALLFLGELGIGKAEAIKDLATDMGIGFKEIKLDTIVDSDIRGIPIKETLDNGDKVSSYSQSDLLPQIDRDGEAGILLLNNITSCKDEVWRTALAFAYTGRYINTYKLPEKWVVVYLGNREEDGVDFKKEPWYKLINRCFSLVVTK